MNDPKALARSIQDRLRIVANKMGAAYENVLTEFFIEKLLLRLLDEPQFVKNLVFKGGYVSLRVYASPRFTVDLDATLTKGKLETVTAKAIATVERERHDGIWFRYEKSVDLQLQGEYGGLRLVFRSGIGDVFKDPLRGQTINLDIGAGDPMTPGPKLIETASLIGKEIVKWTVCPVETTVAEKLNSLVRRSLDNSRSKDIFDLCVLLPYCNPNILKQAIKATFEHCGDPVPNNLTTYLKTINTAILRRGWRSAIADIRPLPDFDETFSSILSQIEEIAKAWR